MKLSEFIEETGIPIARLADRCGLSFHQVYHILNRGGTPTLKTACAIQKYTGGRVSPEDLLAETSEEKIETEEQKK